MDYVKISKRSKGTQLSLTIPKKFADYFKIEGIELMMPSMDDEDRLIYTPVRIVK